MNNKRELLQKKIRVWENNHQVFFKKSGLWTGIALIAFLGLGLIESREIITKLESPEEAEFVKQPFASINLQAKSAIVLNPLNGEILYAKKEQEALPLASITKIMTAHVSAELLRDKKTVTLSPYALEALGEYAFEVGDIWSTSDLTKATLVKSANDGARALAIASGAFLTGSTEERSQEKAFIDTMNRTAREMNLETVLFENPSGLDIGSRASATGSAQDVAEMFTKIIQEDRSILEATTYDEFRTTVSGANYRYVNTNAIVNKIPNLIASKTGFTDLAGGNLGIVYDSGLNQPIVIVVLGSTKNGRFDDMYKLIETTESYLVQDGERDNI